VHWLVPWNWLNTGLVCVKVYDKKAWQSTACSPPGANAIVHFFLTYRPAMLLPSSEWPLKTSAQLIFGHVCTHPPMPMRNKISRVNEPEFTKFLPDVQESPSILTPQSTWRYSHRLYDVSTNNKGGACRLVAVSRHKIGFHSNFP